MDNYDELLIWYSPEEIKEALHIARNTIKFSRKKEDYFTDTPSEFYPHSWVIDAICCAIKNYG